MRSNSGFTLIELMVVIAIVGVIVATAVPRFIDLSNAAAMSAVRGAEGALASASTMVSAQAIVENKTAVGNDSIVVEGQSLTINSGYMLGHWNQTIKHAVRFSASSAFTPRTDECQDFPLCGVGNQRPNRMPGSPITGYGNGRSAMIWPRGYFLSDLCYAYYYNPEDGRPPRVGSVISGC